MLTLKIENMVDCDVLENPYILYETEYDDYVDEKYNYPEEEYMPRL